MFQFDEYFSDGLKTPARLVWGESINANNKGHFEGFPLEQCIVWVGNIMTVFFSLRIAKPIRSMGLVYLPTHLP